jgi:hypothetical protein
VQQDAGSVPVEYRLEPRATPGAGSYYVSGSVFVNNVQPGILNIAYLVVQLSTGQQVGLGVGKERGAREGRPGQVGAG